MKTSTIPTAFLYPSEADLRRLLRRLQTARVGVLGDFCVDAYWAIDSSFRETSVETGKNVHHVRQQRYSPGGAGNVVVNLRALGVRRVEAFGVIGPDPFGEKLVSMLQQLGVHTSGLLIQPSRWDTPVYGKPLLDGVEMERMDFGAFNSLDDRVWSRLLERLTAASRRLDFLIVNQQLPRGWGNPERTRQVNHLLQQKWPGRHLVDSRDFIPFFRGAIRKLNQHEAARLMRRSLEPDDVLDDDESLALARRISRHGGPLQFLTRGSRGILVCQKNAVHALPGVLIIGPSDPVGAGDTVTATLAASLATNVHPLQAACLANLAASITVRKLNQTGTASEPELLDAARHVAYVFHPTLADEVRRARRWRETDLELIEPLPSPPIRFAVFDHDGTISTLRQGWEQVMEPVMIRAILGRAHDTVESSLFQRVRNRVRTYIEQSTGIQTLVQMDALVAMVREFGIVPAKDRLDAQGYKDRYNTALLAMVNDRLARLRRGELEVADFLIKGAVEFLRALRERGITLFLASGTDQEDVVREARSLGYAELFDGGMYGARRGSRACTKEQVIESILERQGQRKLGFMVVGDGPVEMQQARRHGGLALGVASHEERRFGLNEIKRRRLIRAGAHAIAPDFSQWRNLVEWLVGKKGMQTT